MRPSELAGPGTAMRGLGLILQRQILPVAAVRKGKAFTHQSRADIASIGVADREFARVAIGEFRIDAAGEIRPRHQHFQPIGRGLAAGPDLVERITANLPLNSADRATFYGGSAAGYTDYKTFPAAA